MWFLCHVEVARCYSSCDNRISNAALDAHIKPTVSIFGTALSLASKQSRLALGVRVSPFTEREQQEREQLEQEQLEQEQLEREHRKIAMNFARWEDNTWSDMPALWVDPEHPAIVKETIEAYMTQGIRAFNTKLIMMAPDAYYQAVINDRTHTILLVWQDKISIDNRMIEAAAKLREEAVQKVIGLKRTAPDDLPESLRPRKMR
jgi:hypothetical protein